jgi:hypothetical protein
MLEKITLKLLLLVAVLSDFKVLLSGNDTVILLFYINVVVVEQKSTDAACLHNFELFLLLHLTFFPSSFVWTIIAFYAHPLLFVGLYFAVSQVCRFTPRITIHPSYPLVKWSVRIVRQLNQVLKPFLVLFKELKERNKHLLSRLFVSAKKIKTPKNAKTLFWWGGGGGGPIICRFSLFAGGFF